MSGGDNGGRAVSRFFGMLLIVAGGLIAALCGLCTLVVVGSSLSGNNNGEFGGGGMVEIALVVGGVPTAFGGLLIWGGVAMIRGARRRDSKVKLDSFD